jgi:hypothetical protein
MNVVLRTLVRLFVLAAGIVVAAGIAVVFTGLALAWLLRAGWARLTGRPITAFVGGVGPREVFRRAQHRADRVRPGTGALGRSGGDVTDVEAKPR